MRTLTSLTLGDDTVKPKNQLSKDALENILTSLENDDEKREVLKQAEVFIENSESLLLPAEKTTSSSFYPPAASIKAEQLELISTTLQSLAPKPELK